MDETALFEAIRKDQAGLIGRQLESGPLPLIRGNPAHAHAAFFGATATLEALLIHLPDAKTEINRLELLNSAPDGKTCELLIALGADVHRVNQQGMTALHFKAANNKASAARALIKAGANIEAVNRLGETPLNAAVRLELTAMTELLLKAGANPNHADGQGLSPLRQALACQNQDKRLKLVQSLLAHGALVSDQVMDFARLGWGIPAIMKLLSARACT